MEKIRAYHKKFYRPENLYLTITGNIQPEQVFEAIEKVTGKPNQIKTLVLFQTFNYLFDFLVHFIDRRKSIVQRS